MNLTLRQQLMQPLSPYDKPKVNVLKAILPIIIIVHHIANEGFESVRHIGMLGNFAMYIFFAMSGYGLTISYIRNRQYINGFLKKSLTKLFAPYFVALAAFVVYRHFHGVDQVALFQEKGLWFFVPTSWYIYVLSYFYIFFFVVFRYVKSTVAVKVVLTCALVVGYVVVAPHIGIEPWRYNRCPAFCVGMIFALFDSQIRTHFVRWQALAAFIALLAVTIYPHGHIIKPLITPATLFCLMYCLPSSDNSAIVKFLSSISLEMFIIQFIPIYVVTQDMGIRNTIAVVGLVLAMDIALAYLVHISLKRVMRPRGEAQG
ncbi:MAG: acyltransferase [Marinilabiliaceae bacterium]